MKLTAFIVILLAGVCTGQSTQPAGRWVAPDDAPQVLKDFVAKLPSMREEAIKVAAINLSSAQTALSAARTNRGYPNSATKTEAIEQATKKVRDCREKLNAAKSPKWLPDFETNVSLDQGDIGKFYGVVVSIASPREVLVRMNFGKAIMVGKKLDMAADEKLGWLIMPTSGMVDGDRLEIGICIVNGTHKYQATDGSMATVPVLTHIDFDALVWDESKESGKTPH